MTKRNKRHQSFTRVVAWVVSTSIGCEGLAAVDGKNILIRDTPKDFANGILRVLGDEELRRRLGEGGRATVERLYSWDVIGQGLVETYLGLAGQGHEGRVPAFAATESAANYPHG